MQLFENESSSAPDGNEDESSSAPNNSENEGSSATDDETSAGKNENSSASSTNPDNTKLPDTGADSNLGLWLSLLLISAGGLMGIITLIKRHRT